MFERIYSHKFEKIVSEMLKSMDFLVETELRVGDKYYDIVGVGKDSNQKLYIEVKFYRSQRISTSIIEKAANDLGYNLKQLSENKEILGIVALNTIIPEKLKSDIAEKYGITIWDRGYIYDYLSKYSIELRDEFEKLLISSQQGIDTINVFSGVESKINKEINRFKVDSKYIKTPKRMGQKLEEELKLIECGKDGWGKYEKKCLEVLKFLFEDDLTLWEKQSRTDDGLSRFDLICRISSKDDYWKSLIQSFNSRFVIFEFKNYCSKISQNQIYLTERYLYINGLRSVGFIIARTGADNNSIATAKGTLRENGKLILILSNEDLYKMLRMKDSNENPNDYLADFLDKWLISLSR